MTESPAPAKPIVSFFRFLHGKLLPAVIAFYWGAIALSTFSKGSALPFHLTVAAAVFFIGAWVGGKLKKVRECTLLLFVAMLSLRELAEVLPIGAFLSFCIPLGIPFFVFGFWINGERESLPLPFLAPCLLAGGFFAILFPGDLYRYFPLLLLLLGKTLLSPECRFRGKLFRMLFFVLLLGLDTQVPYSVLSRQKLAAMPTKSSPPPADLLTALGSVSGTPRPAVMILSQGTAAFSFYHSLFPRLSLSFGETIPDLPCDLIVVTADGIPAPTLTELLSRRLAPEGHLLITEKDAALLQGFHWLTMPGAEGNSPYLLGSRSPFEIKIDEVEKNLLAITREKGFPDFWLPGEIMGGLVNYHPKSVSVKAPRRLLLLPWVFPVIWLLLESISFRKPKRAEWLLLGESAFAFAAITALLLDSFPYRNYAHATELILPGLALIWLFCRPALRPRMEILLTLTGILGALIWSVCGNEAWNILSLLAGGFAFSGEMRRKQHPGDAASFAVFALGLTLGFLAAWAVPLFMEISVKEALWAALTLKIWTTARN